MSTLTTTFTINATIEQYTAIAKFNGWTADLDVKDDLGNPTGQKIPNQVTAIQAAEKWGRDILAEHITQVFNNIRRQEAAANLEAMLQASDEQTKSNVLNVIETSTIINN